MLKVGILYRIGGALDYLLSHPLTQQQFLTSFGRWDGVSGETVLDSCLRLGWLVPQPTGELSVTAAGQILCDSRHPGQRLRLQLAHIIGFMRPTWAALSVRGRNAVASYAPAEAVQCLSEAGLLDGTDPETVVWWDRLARYYRSVQDDDRTETGRVGERCSLMYERERTGREPNWVALDANSAGYDLISQVSRDDVRRLLIEVKASRLEWVDAEAILTRHEWNVISRAPTACLDLWSLNGKQYGFLRATTDMIRAVVPADVGECEWRTLAIPFRAMGQPVEVTPFASLAPDKPVPYT